MAIRRLKFGDHVRVRLAVVRRDRGPAISSAEWNEGIVTVAGNHRNPAKASVLIMGEGFRGPDGALLLNGLPLTIDYVTGTVTGLLGGEYEIEYGEL